MEADSLRGPQVREAALAPLVESRVRETTRLATRNPDSKTITQEEYDEAMRRFDDYDVIPHELGTTS